MKIIDVYVYAHPRHYRSDNRVFITCDDDVLPLIGWHINAYPLYRDANCCVLRVRLDDNTFQRRLAGLIDNDQQPVAETISVLHLDNTVFLSLADLLAAYPELNTTVQWTDENGILHERPLVQAGEMP